MHSETGKTSVEIEEVEKVKKDKKEKRKKRKKRPPSEDSDLDLNVLKSGRESMKKFSGESMEVEPLANLRELYMAPFRQSQNIETDNLS